MRAIALALLLGVFASNAGQWELPRRSVSSSRQFIVYCDDLSLRIALTSFAEETKTGVLSVLGQGDGWRVPIVVNVSRAEANQPGRRPSEVRLFELEDGFKLQVDLTLGAEPRQIYLQQQLARAVLLEIAYRDQPGAIKADQRYMEPPVWLVEGIVQIIQARANESTADIFRSLIENEKLLPLQSFLAQNFQRLDSTSRQLFCYYAMNLVQLLLEQPDGRQTLGRLLRELPRGNDPSATLAGYFPVLAGSEASVEKWWALGVARLSAADRYKGLSLEESERKLAALLSIRVKSEKGETEKYPLEDFKRFIKKPGARASLGAVSTELLALGTSVHPVFRPIIADYERITSDLARGKTFRVAGRLETASRYRQLVLNQTGDITDYLNWYEATQTATRSDAFDDYLHAAETVSVQSAPRADPISRYIDTVAQEFQ